MEAITKVTLALNAPYKKEYEDLYWWFKPTTEDLTSGVRLISSSRIWLFARILKPSCLGQLRPKSAPDLWDFLARLIKKYDEGSNIDKSWMATLLRNQYEKLNEPYVILFQRYFDEGVTNKFIAGDWKGKEAVLPHSSPSNILTLESKSTKDFVVSESTHSTQQLQLEEREYQPGTTRTQMRHDLYFKAQEEAQVLQPTKVNSKSRKKA